MRPTVTLYVPDGYTDAAAFLWDCQFERAVERAEPIAYITKSALECWLKGVDPETHVFLRRPGEVRVALYTSPITGDSQTLLAELLSRINFDGMNPDTFTVAELRRAV